MDALIIIKIITYLLLFIVFGGYFMLSIYSIKTFKNFNEIFVYSNNLYFTCQQINTKKSIIEGNTDINIQYNGIKDIGINDIIKNLSKYNFIPILYTISCILLLIISYNDIDYYFNNSSVYDAIIRILSFIIVGFVPYISFIYIKTDVIKTLNGQINQVIKSYGSNLIIISQIFDTLVDKKNIFDLNYSHGNKTVQLFKYYLVKRILYIDNLESYEDGLIIYTNIFNDYINKKDEYCKLLNYINFNDKSTDYKLLKAVICGGLSSTINIKNINNINNINNNKILDTIDGINESDITLLELTIKDLMKMSNKDFESFVITIKNKYLYNESSHYKDYQASIESHLINYQSASHYFNNLSYDDAIWNQWQKISINDNSLIDLFNRNICMGNNLNLTPKILDDINNSLMSLSNKTTNLINIELKKIISNFLILMILTSTVIFYIIFHMLYKMTNINAINLGIFIFVIYCIIEGIRINILLQ
jgi:hypothetical protein